MISVVVPTLNRCMLLPKLAEAAASVLDGIQKPYEIIFVDDGSHDNTAAVISGLCGLNPHIRGLILEENCGQQNATLAGIRAARYSYILTLDDDLEYDIQGIHEIVKGLDSGYDAVYIVNGISGAALHRQWGTALKEWVFKVFCSKPPHLRLTSFRGMQRDVADYVAEDPVLNVYISARILQHTRHILNIAVDHMPEQPKTTNYSRKALIKLLWHIVRNYAQIPGIKSFRQTGEQYRIKETLPCD